MWYERVGQPAAVHLIPTLAWVERPIVCALRELCRRGEDLPLALAPTPVGVVAGANHSWVHRLRSLYADSFLRRQRAASGLGAAAGDTSMSAAGRKRPGAPVAAVDAAVPGEIARLGPASRFVGSNAAAAAAAAGAAAVAGPDAAAVAAGPDTAASAARPAAASAVSGPITVANVARRVAVGSPTGSIAAAAVGGPVAAGGGNAAASGGPVAVAGPVAAAGSVAPAGSVAAAAIARPVAAATVARAATAAGSAADRSVPGGGAAATTSTNRRESGRRAPPASTREALAFYSRMKERLQASSGAAHAALPGPNA